jgi:hypothetical protein
VLTNLWRACPKCYAGSYPWNAAFTTVLIFVSFSLQASLYFEEYVCINRHISDCLDIVPGLTNYSVSETVLHKSEEVQIDDWMFITGLQAWRWLGQYVILDKTFTTSFSTVISSSPSYFQILYLTAFLEEAFIWNIIIIVPIIIIIIIHINCVVLCNIIIMCINKDTVINNNYG